MKMKFVTFVLTLAIALSTNYNILSTMPAGKPCYGWTWKTTWVYVVKSRKWIPQSTKVWSQVPCFNFTSPEASSSAQRR